MFMMLFTMSGIHTYADGEAPFAVKTLTDGIVTVTTNDPEFMATKLKADVRMGEGNLHEDIYSSPIVNTDLSLMDGDHGISCTLTFTDDDGNVVPYKGSINVKVSVPESWDLSKGLSLTATAMINLATYATNSDADKWIRGGAESELGEVNGRDVNFTMDYNVANDQPGGFILLQMPTPEDTAVLGEGVYDVRLVMVKDIESMELSMASSTLDFMNAHLIVRNGRRYLRGHFNPGLVFGIGPAFADRVYAVTDLDNEDNITVESVTSGSILSYHEEPDAKAVMLEALCPPYEQDHAIELINESYFKNGVRYIKDFVLDVTDSFMDNGFIRVGFASDVMDTLLGGVQGSDAGYNTTNIMMHHAVKNTSADPESLLAHKITPENERLNELYTEFLTYSDPSIIFRARIFTPESFNTYFVPAWQKIYHAANCAKATQQEVDEAVRAGEEALNNLVLCTVGDAEEYGRDVRGSLKGLLDKCGKVDETLYTSGSLDIIKALAVQAQALYDQGDDALFRDIGDKYYALKKAYETLKLKATDFTALEAAINDAKQVDIEHGKFTKASLDAFKAQLQAAQTMLDNKDASEEEIEAQIKALMAAKNGLADISDYKNLPKGKYEINVSMKKPDRVSTSMADGAIKHTAVLDVTDEGYFLTLDFNGIRIGANFGYLSNLWYYDEGYSYLPNGNPKGSIVPAEVLSTQKNKDGTDVIDQYNDKDHLYPDLTRIKIVNTALADESGFVPLKVMVKIMEAITPGTGEQNVLLKLDWANLKEYKEPENPGGDPGDVIPPAVDITDSATGIRVQAAAGVLPEGVKLVVREITDGAEYQRAGTALESIGKKFKLYDVCVTDKDGNEIQPADILTVSYPVPKGYAAEALQLYRIGEDGSRTLIKGMVMDGYYVVQQKHFSNYALVEKGSRITDAENKKNMGGKPNTGDSPELVRYVVLFAAAALIAGYAYRRRKGGKAE